jgi:hypothetical protein
MALRILRSVNRKKEKPAVVYDYGNAENLTQFCYGRFPLTYSLNFDCLSLSITQENGMHHYKRAIGNWKKESDISVSGGNLLLHPVEPLNLPDNVTDFLEIGFDPVVIEPDGKCVVFLTMPIEIGVFLESGSGSTSMLDIITFVYPKYSLYGGANRGVITRYHKSGVYYHPPSVKNHLSGIIKLEIENKSDEWVTVGRVVIYQKGLYLYFNDNYVAASVSMVIISPEVASVTGVESPIDEDMTSALRLYESRKTSAFFNIPGMLSDTTFTMDMGLM